MRLQVKLFGPAAIEAGADQLGVECPEGATCDAVRDRLIETCPAIAVMARSGRLAVNGRYTPADHPICQTDELALITLVSGG